MCVESSWSWDEMLPLWSSPIIAIITPILEWCHMKHCIGGDAGHHFGGIKMGKQY